MRSAAVRVSRTARLSARLSVCIATIGEVLTIDKSMSRRCLLESAAGALLLSGCSSQDESSTNKVKKQDKIKKAEASDQSKHLRDKDELYEVYDDSGIVTMYLTVSRGNSS